MKEIPAWLVKAIASGERIAAIHHLDTKVPDALVYSGLEFLVERYMPLGQIAFVRIVDLSIQPITDWPMQTAQEMLDTLNRGLQQSHEQTLQSFVPRTPLQRLLKFAAEDGTPVSFEIAEKAMKGGG